MLNKIFFLSLLLFFGCADEMDNAGSNIKKGDTFFAKGEYEIAEYYYNKIPEDSPYYKKAQRKLGELTKLQEEQALQNTESVTETKEEVTVVKHSYQMNNMGRVPFHAVTFMNTTSNETQIIELEFVYFNDDGKEVARLATMVYAGIPPLGQASVEKISPGMVNEKFSRVSVVIQRVLFN